MTVIRISMNSFTSRRYGATNALFLIVVVMALAG